MKDTDLGLLVFLIFIISMAICFLVGNFFRFIVSAVNEDLMVSMIIDYLYSNFKMGTDIHRRSNRCVKKKAAVLIFDLIKIR